MQYDPIKRTLGRVFAAPTPRKLFYSLLDLLLLRSWYIRRELNSLRTVAMNEILDAGCGFGQYSYRLSQLFPQASILSVDVNDIQIADCKEFFKAIKKTNVQFDVADLQLFCKERFFNLILSVDVMEHIEDDVAVFRNFYRSLCDGGVLLISTPSDRGGSDVHEHHEHESAHGFVDEHVRDGYGKHEIVDKLKQAGFSDINVNYAYGPYGQLSWKLLMKFPILLLNGSKLFFLLLPFYYIIAFPVGALLNVLDMRKPVVEGTALIVTATK
jgi:SAM-dependent methyltransferase